MQETDVQNQIREIWSFGWPETNIFLGLIFLTSKRSQFTYFSPVHFIDGK